MAHEIRRTRESWVDIAKVLPCVLIVLAHVFQNLVNENILESTTTYSWFIRTVNYFVFPLLFIVSGYLYQLGTPVKTVDDWKKSAKKHIVALGVPFVLFAGVNCLVKTLFSGNIANCGDVFLQEMLIQPVSPYWALYILAIVFLLTPTLNNGTSALLIVGIAAATKGVSLFLGTVDFYALDTLFGYWLWFALGMVLAFYKAPKALRKQKIAVVFGMALLLLFVTGSVALMVRQVNTGVVGFIFGVCGCSAVVILTISAKFTEGTKKVLRWMSDYIMPVFLMHTIFAACIRNVLLNLGVTNAVVHVAAGLTVSFVCPVLVGVILKKLKWAEFILYPAKFMKFGQEEKSNRSKKVQER